MLIIKQAYKYLDEAIGLKSKNSVAHYIYGEIYFRQEKYEQVLYKLRYLDGDFKNINLIIGVSYLFAGYYNNYIDYFFASNYFDNVLLNDPNNFLYLKHHAYIHEKKGNYLSALEILDKLLSINQNNSLILCYYVEILVNLGRYNEAILYFTKANVIDPENIYNLSKRAITYYIIEEYDKALFDLNKVLQLNPSYDLAYYYRGLVFYTISDISNSILDFEKYVQLNPNDNLAKIQLYYLEHLLNKNNLKGSNCNIITKINQISSIDKDISLLFIRCKIYIELEKYHLALIDFHKLLDLNHDITFISLLQKYSTFWKYVCDLINIDEFIDLGIFEKFDIYIYTSMKILILFILFDYKVFN